MADPKAALEQAIYDALTAALSPVAVYNSTARVSDWPYVVFSAAGGDDVWAHMKERGYVYDYDILAVGTDRTTAVGHASTVGDALTPALAVAGFETVDVVRLAPVDYVQLLEDGSWLFFVGGTFEFELEV